MMSKKHNEMFHMFKLIHSVIFPVRSRTMLSVAEAFLLLEAVDENVLSDEEMAMFLLAEAADAVTCRVFFPNIVHT